MVNNWHFEDIKVKADRAIAYDHCLWTSHKKIFSQIGLNLVEHSVCIVDFLTHWIYVKSSCNSLVHLKELNETVNVK